MTSCQRGRLFTFGSAVSPVSVTPIEKKNMMTPVTASFQRVSSADILYDPCMRTNSTKVTARTKTEARGKRITAFLRDVSISSKCIFIQKSEKLNGKSILDILDKNTNFKKPPETQEVLFTAL